MANVNITNAIKSSEARASIDAKYGPYASVAAAHAALGEEGADVVAVGLTVGIVTGENQITEYWYLGGTTQAHLVPKQAAGGGAPEPAAVSLPGAAATIASLDGNTVYTCAAALNSLTVAALGNYQNMDAVVRFATAAGWNPATSLTMPAAVKYSPMVPTLAPNREYVMCVKCGICTVSEVVSAS